MKRKWKHSGIFHFFYVTYWWCHCVSILCKCQCTKSHSTSSKQGRTIENSVKFGHLTDDTSFLQLLALSRRRSRYMHVLPNERAFHFLFAVFSDSRGENGERESPSLVFLVCMFCALQAGCFLLQQWMWPHFLRRVLTLPRTKSHPLGLSPLLLLSSYIGHPEVLSFSCGKAKRRWVL